MELDYNAPLHTWKLNVKWDVTHLQALELTEKGEFHFDPQLSYETTGYRPLTETLGLDFKKDMFINVGVTHMLSGAGDQERKYTEFFPNSKKHIEWWSKQIEYCKDGMVVNNYRVTGDNYFFLNYYMLPLTDANKKAGAGRVKGHPNFWAAHYEWYHYIELAEILGYDCMALKARGIGFSEIAACLGVRPYTTTAGYSCGYIAFAQDFLSGSKGVLNKAWTQLDFLNLYTEGGMRRVRQKENSAMLKRASKQTKQGEEYGHLAQMYGITADVSWKIRGDRCDRLVFEESGSNPILIESWMVSWALIEINGGRHGTRIAFGTGGDVGKGLIGLEKMFLNPRTYMILPFKHNWNSHQHYVETGFFLPAWKTVQQVMDERGVVNEKQAKAYFTKKRLATQGDPEAYSKLCAESCFTYEEALSKKGQNDFDQVKLTNQRIEVEILKTTPEPRKGNMFWVYSEDQANKVPIGVKFVEHPQGKVEIMEDPIEEDGMVIPNLYVAGIDSIDMGTADSVVSDDGSQFCLVIKKRIYGMGGNDYVVKYMDRPKDVRTAYEQARMLLYWYNCKANLEYTKIAIVGYFRERNFERYLMARPKYAYEGSPKGVGSNLIGTQSSPKMIEYGLNLVRDYVFDHCHQIYYLDMIMQLQDYDFEVKGKYDIIAAMQMCEIGDQDMMGIVAKKPEPEVWDDIGYYWEDGKRKYGIIPNSTNWDEKLFGKQLY
jgi:hypothetical protein